MWLLMSLVLQIGINERSSVRLTPVVNDPDDTHTDLYFQYCFITTLWKRQPGTVWRRLRLLHFEDDIESDRHSERKARNADYQANRCFLDAKDISKQIRDGACDLGWSTKSPAVAMNTLRRTTRVTLSSEPRCSLAVARTFYAAA